MTDLTIGLLHPGAMGAVVGAQAVANGATVHWLPEGRGPATRARAEAAGLVPVADLDELARRCAVIVSVCPPAAAVEVAELVANSKFGGIYVEANAISPARTEQIASLLGLRGVTVVDGGIVGPPPARPGSTRLYLSGAADAVARAAAAWEGSNLAIVPLPGPVGQASALKLAFAGYNKITYALAAQAYALAEAHGVRAEFAALAAATLPGTPAGHPDSLTSAGAKAWRWAPEMHEIADACADADLPADLPEAAAALFARWSAHKDDSTVTLPALLTALRDTSTSYPQAN